MNLLFRELTSRLDNLEELLRDKLRSASEEGFDLGKLELNQLPKIANEEFVTVTYIKSRRIRRNLEDIKSQYKSIIDDQKTSKTSQNKNLRQKISF